MLCGWEGNRRSGIALAMYHRPINGILTVTYGFNGLRKEDEHAPRLRSTEVLLHLYLPNGFDVGKPGKWPFKRLHLCILLLAFVAY